MPHNFNPNPPSPPPILPLTITKSRFPPPPPPNTPVEAAQAHLRAEEDLAVMHEAIDDMLLWLNRSPSPSPSPSTGTASPDSLYERLRKMCILDEYVNEKQSQTAASGTNRDSDSNADEGGGDEVGDIKVVLELEAVLDEEVLMFPLLPRIPAEGEMFIIPLRVRPRVDVTPYTP